MSTRTSGIKTKGYRTHTANKQKERAKPKAQQTHGNIETTKQNKTKKKTKKWPKDENVRQNKSNKSNNNNFTNIIFITVIMSWAKGKLVHPTTKQTLSPPPLPFVPPTATIRSTRRTPRTKSTKRKPARVGERERNVISKCVKRMGEGYGEWQEGRRKRKEQCWKSHINYDGQRHRRHRRAGKDRT